MKRIPFGLSDYRRFVLVASVVCMLRVLQVDDVLGQLYANGAIDKAFERFFSLGLAGFVFVPLFGVLLIQPYHDLALVPVAVRCKSREEILFRYIAASLRRSAFFSFALCVSALPPLLMAGEIWQATISYTDRKSVV